MLRWISRRMTDHEFEQAKQEIERAFEGLDEEERHWVRHFCGYTHLYGRIPENDLRRPRQQVELSCCQRNRKRLC